MWNVNFTGTTENGATLNWCQDYIDMPLDELVAEVLKDGDCDGCRFERANAENDETGQEADIYRDGTCQAF